MNFPTHESIHEAFRPNDSDPMLFHHHHRFEENRVLNTDYEKPNAVIAEINQALATSDPRRSRFESRWAFADQE